MTDAAEERPSKRPREVDESSIMEQEPSLERALIVKSSQKETSTKDQKDSKPIDSVPRAFERLSLTVNPSYLTRLRAANELGYERPFEQRRLPKRHYEIQISNLRDAMTYVLSNFIIWKQAEQGRFTIGQINSEVNEIVPICVDACMTALYAKLRTIHKQYGTYAHRFNAPATYAKDIELPLPFADAIQNFGVFETRCMKKNYVLVPVYPEGIKNEGRKNEEWHSNKYESCLPILRECGIPMKNVDTRIKFGHAWWTYKVEEAHGAYDFRCILPSLHYSDHSAILASMFFYLDRERRPVQIIRHLPDDADYGLRLREVRAGFQLRAFAALCHLPSEEWNSFTNIN
eukprot:TRINITY_DN6185_c0_g1_i1.p1 TRINITY_DN6185_c0_g1~~TRINITY_DN6185_c0_g1_i1.p1  ORF type:complete len:345 (+),score=18.40 TRINITY_DN6185_c0_g1_i1:170-1204(+)